MTKTKEASSPDLLKFSVEKNALKQELKYIQGIIETKSTIPILQNVLIESIGENTLRLTGTNLDVTIRCETEADIEIPGEICINAKKLFEIVNLSDDAALHFTKLENEWTSVKCGKAKYKISGYKKEDFPETPRVKDMPFSLSAKDFNHFINNTILAITNEQSRFTLSGAKFIIGGNHAKMVTTDGHRLALIEKTFDSAVWESMDVLIPKLALQELVKVSDDSDGDVSFGEDPNHIFFEINGRTLITRKLIGTFPNYEMVIPKENDKTVTCLVEELKKAVRRAALMSEGVSPSVKFTIRKGEIEIESRDSDGEEGCDLIDAEYDGEEVVTGFQWRYIDQFLRLPVLDGENKNVSILFKDANTQVLFKTVNDEGFLYVIMPTRI